jgi:Na+-driven multidrug efflux pump
MLLSLSRQLLVFIPCLFILPRFYGLDGILFTGPVADTVSTIITAIWLIMEVKNLSQRHQESLGPGEAGQDSSQVEKSVATAEL